MKKILKNKVTAWAAFVLIIVALVVCFDPHAAWWTYLDVFFTFMAAFVNLVSATVQKINPVVSKKLHTWTVIFCVLAILAFAGEWIALNV